MGYLPPDYIARAAAIGTAAVAAAAALVTALVAGTAYPVQIFLT